MARVVVLGTAQDGGVPQLGCDCCTSLKPRLVSCLGLVLNDGRCFLFDATPDIKAQVAQLPRNEADRKTVVAGVFLTHAHMGHYVGLLQFGKEAACAHRLPVYCSERVAGFLRANEPFRSLVVDERIALITLAAGEAVRLSPECAVTPVAVKHRAELSDTFAFEIAGPQKRVLFCPDADDWSWGAEAVVRRCDAALLDGTFFRRDDLPGRDLSLIPHPFVADSMALFAQDCHRVWFTHLNHSNPLLRDPSPATEKGFHVLEDGQTFEL